MSEVDDDELARPAWLAQLVEYAGHESDVPRLMEFAEQEPDMARFMLLLLRESPRGAILIAGEFANALLERLLRSACFSDSLADSLLDDFNAPLGTFSTRILAARAFGLLPESLYWNMEQLRKLRNYCAHEFGDITFDDAKVRAHVDNFRLLPGTDTAPKVKLGAAVAALESWLRVIEPQLAKRDPHRLLALSRDDVFAR